MVSVLFFIIADETNKLTILMKLFTVVMVLLLAMPVAAQPKMPKLPRLKTANSIKPDIEKVARDYYEQFANMKGDTLMRTGNTIQFASKLVPVGGLNGIITRYDKPLTYSWEANMVRTENFEEAVNKYKQYYRQLNGMPLKLSAGGAYKLEGEFDEPDESRGFASSLLQLSGNDDLQQFKIEIALAYSLPEWRVTILMYEKTPDEAVRPGVE